MDKSSESGKGIKTPIEEQYAISISALFFFLHVVVTSQAGYQLYY